MNFKIKKLFRDLKKGDVVWMDLGKGEGSEQEGVRPCIVIGNSRGLRFSPVVYVIPLTSSTTKKSLPIHLDITVEDLDENINFSIRTNSTILCEQMVARSKSRITSYIGRLSKETINKVDIIMAIALGLNINAIADHFNNSQTI